MTHAPLPPPWVVKNTQPDVHVLPLRDLRAHEESRTCWCQPRLEIYGTCAMVSHNAADGRELVEQHGVN